MILSVIRHGSTAWNEQGLMQGRRDEPLSALGRAQVSAWRWPAALATPVRWYSSPLRRAVETARLLGGRDPQRENALIEMDWGAWEGFALDTLRAHFNPEFARNEALGLDFQPPGGESPRHVLIRVQRWLAGVSRDTSPAVAVTHNGVLRAILAAATGWDMTVKPPLKLHTNAVHQFSVSDDGSLTVLECNIALAAGARIEAP
ncbi:MAG: histidine phosphatase family protein [Betaproteobacteria bacterium]